MKSGPLCCLFLDWACWFRQKETIFLPCKGTNQCFCSVQNASDCYIYIYIYIYICICMYVYVMLSRKTCRMLRWDVFRKFVECHFFVVKIRFSLNYYSITSCLSSLKISCHNYLFSIEN